jgi:hypothetical protein
MAADRKKKHDDSHHDHGLEEIARELHGIWNELHQIRNEMRWLEHIHRELECICKALAPPQIIGFELRQLSGGIFMAITGVQVGGSGTFQIGFVPPNGVPLQSGPTVTVTDDSNVTLGPVGTPSPNQFVATVASTDTSTQFTVQVDGVNGAGTAISAQFVIPIIAAPPPQITDFTLDQVA